MTKVKSRKILNQKENMNITDIRKILNNKKFKKRKYKKNSISKKKNIKQINTWEIQNQKDNMKKTQI